MRLYITLGPLDLIPRPLDQRPSADVTQRVKEIQQLHEKVRARIEKSNLSYSAQANKHRKPRMFQPGDLVDSPTEGTFSRTIEEKIDAPSRRSI